MNGLQKAVARMIYERGSFKFGEFKLKLHEKNPEAPLSPFYLNLRTKNNPGMKGPLTNDDCDLIAMALVARIINKGVSYDAIAGIPYACDPFIEAIERVYPVGFRIVKLSKEVTKDKRRIVPKPGFEYKKNENVLVIDDLVTGGDSKIEAIEAVMSEGSVVKTLIVLVDRQQGGRKQLEEAGYNVITCFTIRELLDFYREEEIIGEEKYMACLAYLKNN